LLIFVQRVKAFEKAAIYSDEFETSDLGVSPLTMMTLFIILLGLIATLAKLKLVGETLVLALIACMLLFIYVLKLTLFEGFGPNFMLPRKRQDPDIAFDSMNRQLFDA